MKKPLILFTITLNFLYSAMIGTGKKQDAGTLLFANYYINFQSDIIRDASQNKAVTNFDWTEETYVFKPVYYTDNFLFHLTIPYRKTESGLLNQSANGLYDISAGVGYFLPNNFGDMLLLTNVLFPTGEFDKNEFSIGQNRYEIQEELHFFKPVLTTKFPFLVDASVFYHHRFENRDTKQKNGYYMGYEATISAILNKDFYIGPTVYYKKYNKEHLISENVGSSKYQIGIDAFYRLTNNTSLTFEYVKDYKVKNRAEGNRFNFRYVHKFNNYK